MNTDAFTLLRHEATIKRNGAIAAARKEYAKSLAHHTAMQAIFVAHYNFCRVHSTIKMTSAMASGLADRALKLIDLLN